MTGEIQPAATMTCNSSFLVSGNHTLIVKRVMYHYFEYKHYLIDMLISILGEWRVALYCQGKRIDSCPVDVCDPSRVKVNDLKGGIVGRPNKFKGENHKRKAGGILNLNMCSACYCFLCAFVFSGLFGGRKRGPGSFREERQRPSAFFLFGQWAWYLQCPFHTLHEGTPLR